MVERLKEAIEKAARERSAARAAPAEPTGTAPAAPGLPAGSSWQALSTLSTDPARLRQNRIVTQERSDPSSAAFDMLRSRIRKAFRDNGWKRLAITSPTKGCGKTFVSVNLAFSFGRQPDIRALLVDLDLRAPSIATRLGQQGRFAIKDFLTGSAPAATQLRRIGENLAVTLNTERVRDAAELLLERRTATILADTIREYDPDIVIYDLPPMLGSDDSFGFLPNTDAVLLVVAAGQTRAREIETCERLLEGQTAFLGVVLNKATEISEDDYGYGSNYE